MTHAAKNTTEQPTHPAFPAKAGILKDPRLHGGDRITKPRKSGWSPERRARQAARIKLWAPWAKSTGPRTIYGKSISSQNSHKHGYYSQSMRLHRLAMRRQSRFIRNVGKFTSVYAAIPPNELLKKWEEKLKAEGREATKFLLLALIMAKIAPLPAPIPPLYKANDDFRP